METEIELFLALAQELHFGRAAERMGISTGRASQMITKFEQRVGYRLFERTTRRVELTSAGAKLEPQIRHAWRQLMDALSGNEVSGTLAISFMGPAAAQLLGGIGNEFMQRYPDCHIELRDLRHTEIAAGLRSRQTDLAFAPLPFDEPDFTVGPVLLAERRALVVKADHPLNEKPVVTLEDLAVSPLLQSPDTLPESYRRDRNPLTTPSGVPITQGPVVNTVQEAFLAVAMGRGIVQLSAQTTPFHGRSDVRFLPIADAPTIDWGLVWLSDSGDHRPPIFAQFAAEVIHSVSE